MINTIITIKSKAIILIIKLVTHVKTQLTNWYAMEVPFRVRQMTLCQMHPLRCIVIKKVLPELQT